MMLKRALVTGGSRGIGKAISLMLARNGFDVIINYRGNKEAAESTKKEIEQLNVKCTLLQFDISDFKNAKKAIEEELKNGPIQVLILNAGIRKDCLFPLMKDDDWDNVVDINLKSFYYIARPISKSMFDNKYGKIVVISSTSGLTGIAGQVNYCASKAGVIGAAKALAVELARRNINVNVVTPGYIETDMIGDIKNYFEEIRKTIPLKRIGSVDDVANVVEFLVSEKSNYIVGQVIPVNGGVYI
jgi:3-oxoacyl-[acyl-carrier protein] reductase